MDSSGSVERVPLKVVPMFIEEQTIELPEEPVTPPPEPAEAAPRGPLPWVGVISIVLGVVAAIVQIIAIVGATDGDLELGIVLGYLAVIIAIAAVFLGIAAIIVKRGRRAGVVGILLGILANPLILLMILRFLDGAQA
ncbi:hypothetical protein QMG83_14140 [Salinibacterium sp. G-O1]|uniref:hypothetical protein n=1 Tax=Salinibacterium sp. G-O1 TaxID=3046208 RepID=UPI0024B97541|nr:hypothetical protein [Salinibacterium sp. G-O1]MDJ0336366.1 hypothetical protein [Salinibacterium sp. G-O1]